MIDTSKLEYGIQYDLEMHSGHIHKGWYVYDIKCGYFTKTQGKQTDGFVYIESIKSIKESEK